MKTSIKIFSNGNLLTHKYDGTKQYLKSFVEELIRYLKDQEIVYFELSATNIEEEQFDLEILTVKNDISSVILYSGYICKDIHKCLDV